jgi:hypothetical protein
MSDALLLFGDELPRAVENCSDAVAAAVRANPVSLSANVDWKGFKADLGDDIEKMLDINPVAVVVGAWKDLKEVRAAGDRTAHPPDETVLVPLTDHDVEASVKPHVDVTVGYLPVMHIPFEIALDIELSGVVAIIRDASIFGFRLARCSAAIKVKCKDTVIFERKKKDLDVPGRIILPEQIPIGPSTRN